jgi:molybdate transport system substrate-binding protein
VLNRRRFALKSLAIAGVAAIGISIAPLALAADNVVVFAAASMKNALDDVADAWKDSSGKEATVSYAASSALAKQIEQGAPADIFVSADLDWMKYLSDKGLTRTDSEAKLLGNKIVLIAPKDSKIEADIGRNFPLADLLAGGRLAIANTDSVPAGKYGKQALQSLGVWDSVSGKTAPAENVRAALKLVATGEAPLGIVYQTDAAADPDVRIVGAFPDDSHKPIIYPVAILADSSNADAAAFLKFMESAEAKPLFEAQGFTVLAPEASN